MDAVIRQVISDKIIKYDDATKGYECLICNIKLTGEVSLQDHLKSTKHRDVGGKLAIKNFRISPQSLRNLLSEVIKEAVKDGDLDVLDSKEIQCLVCDSPSQGIIAVEAHLLGKSHKKKKAARPQQVAHDGIASPQSSISKKLDPDIQKNISDKVIKYDENNKKFECLICDVKLTGESAVQDHLRSNRHRDVAGRLVIKNFLLSSQTLRGLLPKVVIDAAQRGDLRVMDSKDIMCLVCNSPNQGIITLEVHLQCNSHMKKIDSRSQSETHIAITSPRNPSFTFESPALQQAVSENIVTYSDANEFNCIICDCKFTGEIPLAQHLDSKKHNQAGARYAISNYETAPRSLVDKLSSDVQEAAGAGFITVANSRELRCNICNVSLNGINSLEEHLAGDDHKKTAQSAISPGSTNILVTEIKIMSPPKPSDDTGEASNEETRGASKRQYSVKSNIRGHVYVFNYTFKRTSNVRSGAEHDSRNLQETFTKMGYEVFVFEDLTLDETNTKIEEIRRKPNLNEIDSFIMFILSHGLDDYTFQTHDEGVMDLRAVRKNFTDRNCPHLIGKPKIILANYCRGDQMQRKDIEEYDSSHSREAPRDMVTIHAATEGIKAIRKASIGTIFVASFCEVLKKYAKEYDLRDMYHELEDIMKEKKGTRPMWEDYGFKHFYFNPKN